MRQFAFLWLLSYKNKTRTNHTGAAAWVNGQAKDRSGFVDPALAWGVKGAGRNPYGFGLKSRMLKLTEGRPNFEEDVR